MYHIQNGTWNRVSHAVAIVYIKISAYEFKYKIKPKRLQFIKVAQCLFGHLIVIKYYSLYKVFFRYQIGSSKIDSTQLLGLQAM